MGFALLAATSVCIISLAAAHGDDSNDATAADYASVSQIAATTAAEQRLASHDPAGAKIFARQALSVSPISVASLRSLSLAEKGLGNRRQANGLLAQAAALGWRDTPTQLMLAQAFLEEKDYGQAAERLDAVMRTSANPDYFYDALDQLIADKAFAKALTDRLLLKPYWRGLYLFHTNNITAGGPQPKAELLANLARSSPVPLRDEGIPIVLKLIQLDQVADAHRLWLIVQHTPEEAVYDPTFKMVRSSDATPFEWQLLPVIGASAVPIDGGGLNVTSDDETTGTLARQTLALSAGRHALEISATPSQAPGIRWTLQCAPSGVTILDAAPSAAGISTSFDVPPECIKQVLNMQVGARGGAPAAPIAFHSVAVH